MTKVEAIRKVLEDNGGAASLSVIYDKITKYYPTAKQSHEWEAGIRGVLYRAIRENKGFKKIGLSIYALSDYTEESKPKANDKVRMHSFMEGICLELGNIKNYNTYTADPSAIYRDNLQLCDFATIHEIPPFSYDRILHDTRLIDVVWFNKKGLAFPQKAIEIVDSIGTLNGAFNRTMQLKNFVTDFIIVAPEKHHDKFLQTMDMEVYQDKKDRYTFINYDDLTEYYETCYKERQFKDKFVGL